MTKENYLLKNALLLYFKHFVQITFFQLQIENATEIKIFYI